MDSERADSAELIVPEAVSLAMCGNALFAADTDHGEVRTYRLTPDGLTLQSRVPSGGVEPCHVVVDPTGNYLLTTNYHSSTLVVRRIVDGDLGEITDVKAIPGSGPVADRQQSSHFHQAVFDPAGEVVVVCDLGADSLHGFRLDTASGTLEHAWSASAPAGSGPRHAVFRTGFDYGGLLVADELSSTVSWYRRTDDGQLAWVRSAPSSFGGIGDNYPSEIVLSADARFAYVGNRGFDTIGVLSVTGTDLTLIGEVASGGMWPQHLMLRGAELFCAVRDSDAVNVFAVDLASGELQLTSGFVVRRPTWILEVAV